MAAPQHRPDPRRIPDVPDRDAAIETIEDLTLRIEMAELRVVRRDLEFQVHWDSLQQRGKSVLVPSRWLLPALGTGASWLFWRVVRGKRHRPGRRDREERHEHGDHGRHGQGHGYAQGHGPQALHGAAPRGGQAQGDGDRPEFGTLQLLTMLWGFMPARLRGSVGPEITQLLLGVIAGFMQGRKQQREDDRAAHERAAHERAAQEPPAR